MKVEKSFKVGEKHWIEIGKATWDDSQASIRNRYETASGGFSPRSSSELPLGDVLELVAVLANENLLKPSDLADIMALLSESLKQQLKKSQAS